MLITMAIAERGKEKDEVAERGREIEAERGREIEGEIEAEVENGREIEVEIGGEIEDTIGPVLVVETEINVIVIGHEMKCPHNL